MREPTPYPGRWSWARHLGSGGALAFLLCACSSEPLSSREAEPPADLEERDGKTDAEVVEIAEVVEVLEVADDGQDGAGAELDVGEHDTVSFDSETSEVVATSPAMRLHVLDVGQGDAIIVELPCGAMLIDSGGEVTEPTASSDGFDSVEALESQVRAFFAGRPDLHDTFDLVVLTHPHIDHTRGVARLLEMVDSGELLIRNVLTNGAEGSGLGLAEQRALHDFADAAADVERWYVLQRTTGATGLANEIIDPFDACASAGDGDMSAGGGALIDPRVTALWGRVHDASELASSWQDEDLSNANNHSVVLRIDFGAASVLLTGDLEEVGIAALIAQYAGSGLLDVDVYKAGHHGSYNGTTAALVNAMSPRAAVISAGPATRFGDWTAWEYGHPRWPAVSDLLGDGDSDGVSAARPDPIDALVAIDYAQGRGQPFGPSAGGHGVFESRHIAQAVYCTGWEGAAVTITLRADGTVELPH